MGPQVAHTHGERAASEVLGLSGQVVPKGTLLSADGSQAFEPTGGTQTTQENLEKCAGGQLAGTSRDIRHV
jgi:hypothetical protein